MNAVTWPRVAPAARSSPTSRTRSMTVIESVLKMRNAPANRAIAAISAVVAWKSRGRGAQRVGELLRRRDDVGLAGRPDLQRGDDRGRVRARHRAPTSTRVRPASSKIGWAVSQRHHHRPPVHPPSGPSPARIPTTVIGRIARPRARSASSRPGGRPHGRVARDEGARFVGTDGRGPASASGRAGEARGRDRCRRTSPTAAGSAGPTARRRDRFVARRWRPRPPRPASRRSPRPSRRQARSRRTRRSAGRRDRRASRRSDRSTHRCRHSWTGRRTGRRRRARPRARSAPIEVGGRAGCARRSVEAAQRHADLQAELGEAADQRRRVVVGAPAELDRVADAPVADDEDPVGVGRGLRVVGDEHDRLAALVAGPPERIEDLGAGGVVEVAGRLVGKEERRAG